MENNEYSDIKDLVDSLTNSDAPYESDELTHWGIKGMRWGVRRYQNKDGSLTARGQKRYNSEMAKLKSEIKTETAKVKNHQKTAAKLDKLEAAKKKLKNLKKGKADSEETDDQKRDRIMKNPTAKDVYENRHLFSNKEVGDLFLRLNNEENIKKLVPKEVDPRKARIDKFIANLDDATEKAKVVGKAYNFAATVVNAFSGADSISMPKLDLDSLNKGNKETRRQEEKRADEDRRRAEEDRKKAKAADSAAKAEAKRVKAEEKAARTAQKAEKRQTKAEERAAKAKEKADEAARKANESTRKANESTSYEYYNSTYSKGYSAAGKNYVKRSTPLLGSSTSALSSTTVNKGRSAVEKNLSYELLDSGGNILLSYGRDDN